MRKIIIILAAILCPALLQAQNIDLENAVIDAVALLGKGEEAAARTALEKIHAADSTCDAALFYLALIEIDGHRAESGAALLEKAAELDPGNIWYRSTLANLYVSRGEHEKAAPLLEKLAEEDPGSCNNPWSLTLLGDSCMRQRRDSAALGWYERALMIAPDYTPAEIGKAQACGVQGNYAGYFRSLGRVMLSENLEPEYKVDIVKGIFEWMDAPFYWVWGEQVGALVDTLSSRHPRNIGAQELAMQMCYIREDKQGALDCCLLIAEIAREQGETQAAAKALGNAGDLYHDFLGDEKSAFRAYEQALRLNPEHCPTLNNYAYFLSLKGRKLRKAEQMSAVTIEKEPDNATYLDTYGWILHLRGKDAEAKPLFKHAMIYGGRENAVVLSHYAEVLRALGENDKADYYSRLSGQKSDK